MKIRAVTKDDFARFKELFCQYYEELDCEEAPEETFGDYVKPDLEAGLLSAAVAVDGETIVGFIIYQIDDVINDWCFKDGCGDVRELFVSPSARNSGAGTALVAFAEAALKTDGASEVYLLPTEESEKFFLKLGFQDNGEYCAEIDSKVFAKLL